MDAAAADRIALRLDALPNPIPDPLVELLANRLRAIGDPTRIRLLDHLRHGPASVQELVDAAGTSPQNVSKHMTRLIEPRFVVHERHGNDCPPARMPE